MFYGERPTSSGADESEGISSRLHVWEEQEEQPPDSSLLSCLCAIDCVHALILQVFPRLYVPAGFCQRAAAACDVKQLLFGALSLIG